MHLNLKDGKNMSMTKRIRRAVKELLGQKQWPRNESVIPKDMDELLLEAIIQPGDLIYDVGANDGKLAIYMANKSGPSGKVVGFEPVWRTYERLCENSNNTDYERAPIITVPIGLSNTDCFAEIALPEGKNALASTATFDAVKQAHHVAWADVIHCGLITLDTFQRMTGLSTPDVVKIDVEGAEHLVLRGASGMLSGSRKPILFMELFAPWLSTFGIKPWDVLSLLHTYGYRHLFSLPEGLVEFTPTEQTPVPSGYEQGYNVISFIPHMHQGRRERLDVYMKARNPRLLPMPPPPMPNI
jgi:FkbM family methyltransferase